MKPEKRQYTQEAYEIKKNAAIIRSRQQAAEGREIGPLPPVENPERKAKAFESFQYFAETYFPHIFTLAWSKNHITAIERIESTICSGGKFALAMPRGNGKTSLLTIAMIWGLVTGRVKHGVLVSATAEAAHQILDDIKTEIEGNNEGPDFLGKDFPEVCYPIRKLDAIHARCRGQILDGQRTKIQFVKNGIVLPTVEGSAASGSIVVTRGLLAGIRGLKKKNNRPDCVLLDDPQTDLSAKSPTQTTTRIKVISRGIKGLAGPGKTMAILAAVTVIEPSDLASTLLDRSRFPSWHGERFQMLESFPDNMELWQKYADIRRTSLLETNSDEAADKVAAEFYLANREGLEAGAIVSWPERFDPGEVSAIQNAMNLYFDDKPAFFSEYQNDPMSDLGETIEITGDVIRRKTIPTLKRFTVPLECQHITAAIDVHKNALFYMVCGWSDKFGGHIMDYGTFPDQKTWYPFAVENCRFTLESTYSHEGIEGAIYSGLGDLTEQLFSKRYVREDGSEMTIKQCLIDARWGEQTATVRKFCRQSKHTSLITPSFGVYIGPADTFGRKPKAGERIGMKWRMPVVRPGEVRSVEYDTNFWKTFMSSRMISGVGDKGTLTIFGNDHGHEILIDHCTAEFCTPVVSRGLQTDIWKLRPSRHENHLFDLSVMNCVAASMLGVSLESHDSTKPKVKKPKIKFSELQKNKRRS